VLLCDYTVARQKVTGRHIEFEFAVRRRDTDLMEYMVHSVRNRRNVADWTAGNTTGSWDKTPAGVATGPTTHRRTRVDRIQLPV